jgi:hypothetical protein
MENVRGRFGICICNDNCDDLELLKVYQILPDDTASSKEYVRVVDGSAEDYLYPQSFFSLWCLSCLKPQNRVCCLL